MERDWEQSSCEVVTFWANMDARYWCKEPLHLFGAAGSEKKSMWDIWRRRKRIQRTGGNTENTQRTYFPFSLPPSSQIPLYNPSAPSLQKSSSTSESTNSAQSNLLPIHLPTCHQRTRTSKRLPAAKGWGGSNCWEIHPQRADSPEGLIQSPPFCLWSSYRYTQWQTLLLINKTPQNIKLKILRKAGGLLPASLHEDETSDSYLPVPETCLCRLCPELHGAWKALLPATASAERHERTGTDEGDRGRRQYATRPCSYMEVDCTSLSVMGISYTAKDFVNLLNYLWREHMFTNFFCCCFFSPSY